MDDQKTELKSLNRDVQKKRELLDKDKDKSKEEILNYFNEVLENQRLKMEEEITSNIKHSLKNILQTLV